MRNEVTANSQRKQQRRIASLGKQSGGEAKIEVYHCERIARQAVFVQKKKQRVIFIFALFSSELERKDVKW